MAGITIFSDDSSFSDADDNFDNSCGVDGLYSVVNNFISIFNSEDDVDNGSIGDYEIRFDEAATTPVTAMMEREEEEYKKIVK